MALRAVPRTRNSRMARSIDRNPAREFAAGYFERVSGRPVHQRTVAADQRPHRAARRQRFLHPVLLRQFRVNGERTSNHFGVSSLVECQALAQFHGLPQDMRSTQVMVRFGLRMIILVIFASFGGIGFGRSLAALLWMSTVLSAVVGAIRREAPFGVVLN